jgi:two-component system OmpR family sensor kinase
VQIQQLERLLTSAPSTGVELSRLRSMVATSSRQLKRFQDLCDQFLDITRLTLGKLELKYEQLDFRELVAEQLGIQAEAASRAGSKLLFDCEGPILGEWDRMRLEHIVCHLLSNAIKFGAGQPITLTLDALEDRVWLQVTDRGIGIAPEDHERIFERLERAVDSRHYGGLGLGLWIVRQSVEALGGSITVSSTLGEGATFTVELPRAQQPQRWVITPPAVSPG